MTKTITTDKTILVLAFAVTFLAGAAVFSSISDYEVEAKPKPKDPDCNPICPPIFKPMNATLFEILAQMNDLKDELDVIKSTGNDHGVILDDLQSTGNDHGVILGDLQTTVSSIDGKADGIKSVVDTIDAKVP